MEIVEHIEIEISKSIPKVEEGKVKRKSNLSAQSVVVNASVEHAKQ